MERMSGRIQRHVSNQFPVIDRTILARAVDEAVAAEVREWESQTSFRSDYVLPARLVPIPPLLRDRGRNGLALLSNSSGPSQFLHDEAGLNNMGGFGTTGNLGTGEQCRNRTNDTHDSAYFSPNYTAIAPPATIMRSPDEITLFPAEDESLDGMLAGINWSLDPVVQPSWETND
jgi:hypothetical protein